MTSSESLYSCTTRQSSNVTEVQGCREKQQDELEKQQINKKKYHQFLSKFLNQLLVLLGGALLAVQAGCNATLNRYGGESFSSVVSYLVGTAFCLLFFIFDVLVLKTELPTNRLKSAPYYAWLGGALGAVYIIVNILTVPKLGTGTVLSIFVCAELIMGCVIDHFALVGVQRRKYTIWRLLASVVAVGCVVVIYLF